MTVVRRLAPWLALMCLALPVGAQPDSMPVGASADPASDATASASDAVDELATAEAFTRVCSDGWPARASQFAASLTARQRCVSSDAGAVERLRASGAYRDRYQTIADEMQRMPTEQVRQFCETLLESHC